MRRIGDMRSTTAVLLLLCGFWGVSRSEAADEPWVFDVVRLTSGAEFQGLIISESPTQLSFTTIRRQPGRPTVFIPTTFSTREIAQVARLSDADRDQLARKIELLRNESASRESRLKHLELQSAKWEDNDLPVLRYKSDWFVLESDAPESIVRRSAIRLEEIFAAFGRFIVARPTGGLPTTIRVYRSCERYKQAMRRAGRQFDNAGYYDASNRIIECGSDLDRLGADLARVRQHHQQLNSDMEQRETALNKIYKGSELLRHLQPIRDARQRIEQAEKQNEAIFAQSTRRLFGLLAHEAFHAYIDTGANLPPQTQLPRWLNEGLAQVFESAIVEGGELRLGHADPERLKRIKQLVSRQELLPLVDVLRSRPEQFREDHGSRVGQAEKRYLTVWALAMYLTFDRQVIGGRDFKHYLVALGQGGDAVTTFGTWVGGDLAAVERDWHQYLTSLQVDGSRAKLLEGK